MYCQDLQQEIVLYEGLTLRCIEACYKTGLVKGLWYKVVQLSPLELEEEVMRRGESAKRRVQPASVTNKLTLAASVTAASVQEDTVEATVAIGDLKNPQMCRKDVLEMAVGRATEARNLRFL